MHSSSSNPLNTMTQVQGSAMATGRQPARWMKWLSRVAALPTLVIDDAVGATIGGHRPGSMGWKASTQPVLFSMGKANSSRGNVLWHAYTYMYVCLQVWTWLQALHINVCLFACLGLASGLTKHYKTLNDFSSPKVEDLKTKPNKILLRIETFKI